ncbi:PRC-barrel domain-containing protein [Ralstonia soli]|uniref:PRC-barrel domain-containing protein n=1 Tax=Ralstonia soli TaxID=2953896 RepID=A0ABT1ASW7_9RALS|nr:PRC-barrel domain-containing protein [Ralstonia soli]MCO5401117.1 PRC-barrel domain-containing protein [Ralstonia soli]
MKRLAPALLATVFIAAAPPTFSQVAGHAALGVSVTELDAIIQGVSVKKQVLGKPVYNEANQKVGNVQDLIVTPENAVSFAIVGAGGFVGVGRHDVAIPVNQFKYEQGKIVLPGATKDAIKALPEFKYERQEKPAKA